MARVGDSATTIPWRPCRRSTSDAVGARGWACVAWSRRVRSLRCNPSWRWRWRADGRTKRALTRAPRMAATLLCIARMVTRPRRDATHRRVPRRCQHAPGWVGPGAPAAPPRVGSTDSHVKYTGSGILFTGSGILRASHGSAAPGRQAGSGRFGAGAASGRVVGAVRGLPLPVPGGSWAHPEAPGQDADGRRVDLTCDLADQLHGSLAWPPIPPRRGPCAWWPPARCSDAPPKRPWPPRARRWRGRGPACPGPVGRGPPRGPGRSPRRPARWAR